MTNPKKEDRKERLSYRKAEKLGDVKESKCYI